MIDTKEGSYTNFQKNHSTTSPQEVVEFAESFKYTEDYATEIGPTDTYNLVYLIFLLQGTGVLFPWNAFISSPDYFMRLYGNQTLFYFSLAYSYPNLIGLIFMVKFGKKIPIIYRILVPYFVIVFVLLAVPIMGFAGIENHRTLGLALTLVLVVLTGVASSVLQGSLFGFGGMFPPKYMTALMSGNGVAGFLVSLLRVLTKATIESGKPSMWDLTLSSSIYFFLSCFIVILCIISFVFALRSKFTQHYMLRAESSTESRPIQQVTDYDEENIKSKISIIAIAKKIWLMALSVFLTFVVTIGLFPGLVTNIPSSSKNFMVEWLPVFLVLDFNLFDLIGRYAPSWYQLKSTKIIAWSTISRVLLIILFMFCIRPKLFHNDLIPIALVCILGLSNGYLSSMQMMTAPQLVESYERETAGMIMTFMLVFGITMGSNLGIGLGYAVGIKMF